MKKNTTTAKKASKTAGSQKKLKIAHKYSMWLKCSKGVKVHGFLLI